MTQSVTKDMRDLFLTGNGGERLASFLLQKLRAFAHRYESSRFDGDDILQDLLVQVVTVFKYGNVKPEHLTSRNSFARFAGEILKNVANQRLRREFYTKKRAGKTESLDDEVVQIAASIGLTASDLACLRELFDFASVELQTIPEGQKRDVLTRMALLGEKAREVADSYSDNLSEKERAQLADKFNRWFRVFCQAFKAKSEEHNWDFKDLEI